MEEELTPQATRIFSLQQSDPSVQTGRELPPPFTHNVYIGHCFNDSPHVNILCQELEERFSIRCYPRHIRGDNFDDELIKQRIDEGVSVSEKCLLIMSEEYEKDKSSNYETQTIHNKAKRFSNEMVIVLWLKIPRQREFSIYKYFEESIDLATYSSNLEKLSTLARLITKVLLPTLVCLPKENIGYGAATGYFYGFLRLVLPGFRKRCHKAVVGYDKLRGTMINRTVGKMFIILAYSCFAPQTLATKGKIEEMPNLNVTRWANRAGNLKRDYKSSVYKLVDQKNTGEDFYFAGELATPLLTLYETYCYGLFGMTLDQLYMERDAFCYTLHQILQHPENRECNDEFRIVMWDDRKGMDASGNTELCDLLLPLLREELQKEQDMSLSLMSGTSSGPSSAVADKGLAEATAAQQAAGGGIGVDGMEENNVANMENENTYNFEGEGFTNLSDFWDNQQVNRYFLGDGIRGKALIINNIEFRSSSNKTVKSLKRRSGAEQDRDEMKKLFVELRFDCAVYENVTKSELDRLLMTYNSMDHSDYDAFICCIMTHGRLGEIYTSDTKPYRILDVVGMFFSNVCPSLRGKPKLFFIQSCQRGNDTDSPDESMRSLVCEDQGSNFCKDPSDESSSGPTPDKDTQPSQGEKVGLITDADKDDESTAGCSRDKATQTEDTDEEPPDSRQSSWNVVSAMEKAVLVPGEPDILMSYSALPGSISYRDIRHGSLYISALAENLSKPTEIDRALKKVTLYVEEKVKECERDHQTIYQKQLPFHLTTGMSKLLFLKPAN